MGGVRSSHDIAIRIDRSKYSRKWAVLKGDGELIWGRAFRHLAVLAHSLTLPS